MLQEYILAGDAHISSSILHIGWHIGGADDDDAQGRYRCRQYKFVRRIRILKNFDTGRSQERQGFLVDAALGKSKRQRRVHVPSAEAIRRIEAPRRTNFCSMHS